MNKGRTGRVPLMLGAALLAASGLIAGCVGPPDLDASADPLVVTEAGGPAQPGNPRPGRAAAIAEMRAKAAAGDSMAYPDASQAAQTARLAARAEPKPIGDVAALQAELETVAQRRQAATTAGEIAGFEARESELRRLLAAARAGDASR